MINFNIEYIQEADSTNDYLKSLMLDSKPEENTVILAEFQKSGRGRGQNRWHSAKGQNLTFSFIIQPKIQAEQFFHLTEMVSLSIVDFLLSKDIEASIKWPNDIYVGDNKIAGILIENTIIGNHIFRCIAGVGINVNEIDFPPDLPNPTSMRMQKKVFFELKPLLGMFLEKMAIKYDQFKSGDLDLLHEEYNQKLYKRDVLIQFKDKNGLFNASIKEIKASGELILRKENNSEKGYLFGEIEMLQIGK